MELKGPKELRVHKVLQGHKGILRELKEQLEDREHKVPKVLKVPPKELKGP